MQIDRPHTLYNFDNDTSHKGKSSVFEKLNKPSNKKVDDQCVKLQQQANSTKQQQDTSSNGIVVPFEDIISGNCEYTVKI